jgi:signal peptidase I
MIGKIFKVIVNTFLFALIALGILVVFSFVPVPGNFKIFTVQSGSMEPAIHTGSLIFVKPEADYNVGDIITRRTEDPKITITHRIYAKNTIDGQIAFETKGDANDAPDGTKFTKDGIIGKEILKLPYIGYPVSYARTSQGIVLLIIIPAVIIIYDEIRKIKDEIKKKIQYKKAANARKNNLSENEIKEEKV